MATHPFSMLPPFDRESGDLHVVIDTPKGSRNKFAWREKRELFELGGSYPRARCFPIISGLSPMRAAVMAMRLTCWC